MVFAALIAITACGDKGPTEAATPIGGFALESIDGRTIPLTLATAANYRLEITAGTLDLAANGTFTATMVTKQTVDNFSENYVDSTAGTWQRTATGSYAFLVTGEMAADTAAWTEGKLTFTDRTETPPVVLVYKRR
jgi:hypothetical protein